MNSDTTFHPVSVIGLGFGTDSSDTQYQVSVSVQGRQLPSDASQPKRLEQRDIFFPGGMLSGLFNDMTLTKVPLHLTSVIRHKKHRFFGGDTFTNDPPVSIDFDLLLLPRQAGTVTFSYLIPNGRKLSGDLVTEPPMEQTVKDCSTSAPCVIQTGENVADDKHFVESTIKYSCIGAGCDQCFRNPTDGEQDKCISDSTSACNAQVPLPVCKEVPVPAQPGPGPVRPCALTPGGRPDGPDGALPPRGCTTIVCPGPDRGQQIAACIESRCASLHTAPDYTLSKNNTRIDVRRSCTSATEATVRYDVSSQALVDATTPGTQSKVLRWGEDTVVLLPTDAFVADGRITFTNQGFTFDQKSGTSNPFVSLVSVTPTDDGQFRVTIRPIRPILN